MNEHFSAEGYLYNNTQNNLAGAYLLEAIKTELAPLRKRLPAPLPLFDLGCGNGSVGAQAAIQGCSVTGVEPSSMGIAEGRKA